MAESSTQEGLNNILSAINNVVDRKTDILKFDKTYRGKVTAKVTDGIYKIQINNIEYQLPYAGTLNVGDIVHVKSPLNNFSDIYIEATGSGGGGTGGTSNYNDLSNKPLLNTTATTSLVTSETETIKGTINLHKVSKTGSYNDLNNKPGNATTSSSGFMSSEDKTKLDGIDSGAQANVITSVKRNGTTLPIVDKSVDITVPTKTSDLTNDGDGKNKFLSEVPIAGTDTVGGIKVGKGLEIETDGTVNIVDNKYELISNKVTSINANSTDIQYPSAKCVYDIVGDIETILASVVGGG